MTDGAVSFTVFGEAAPAGSKRGFVRGDRVLITDDSKRSKPWKAAVSAAAGEAMNGAGLLEGALFVSLVFFRPRPKTHFGTGRNAGVLKESAPTWPLAKPDVLKLARAAEDAMTGIVYRDDASIVVERIEKRYGEPARLEVLVGTIEAFREPVELGGIVYRELIDERR